jgi:hypothetical protein
MRLMLITTPVRVSGHPTAASTFFCFGRTQHRFAGGRRIESAFLGCYGTGLWRLTRHTGVIPTTDRFGQIDANGGFAQMSAGFLVILFARFGNVHRLRPRGRRKDEK